MTPTRRVPINFASIARESGMRRFKLCHSPHFGWVAQNHSSDGPDMAIITAPVLELGETALRIEDGHWCFYAEGQP